MLLRGQWHPSIHRAFRDTDNHAENGEPIVRPGIPVYTFARQGDVWRAERQTWGRLS